MVWAEDSEQVGISFKDYPQLTREERAMIREDLFKQLPPVLRLCDRERAKQLFYRVISAGSEANPLLQKACMTELIGLIISEHAEQPLSLAAASKNEVARMLRDYIDSAFETPITLESLEKQFSYNRFYLEKQFVGCYGISIIAYRNILRTRRAKELLREHSVTETAEVLGYSSVYAFSRAFKNSCGENPSVYMKRARQGENIADSLL